MKVRSLSSIVLLTALVAGIAVPTAANAEDTTTTSPNAITNGSVTVKAGEASPSDPIVDPEDPNGPTIDPGEIPNIHPGGSGSLAITNTTDLKFGTISTGNAVINKDADANSLVDATTKEATGEKRGALVAWSDMRGTNAGYTITAAMTQQFTLANDTKTLGGATITYTNPLMETKEINKAIAPALTSDATSFTLGEKGDAVTVVNAKAGTGAGTYVLEFGQSANYKLENAVLGGSNSDGKTDTTGSSVNLTVPQATAASMTLGDYTAKITWSIVAAPTTPDTPAGA